MIGLVTIAVRTRQPGDMVNDNAFFKPDPPLQRLDDSLDNKDQI